MKVKCPECGRLFDVPSSQLNRSLRCVCKASFKATEFVLSDKEVADSSSAAAAPPTSTKESIAKPSETPAVIEDETIDAELTMSDTEVSRMVAALSAEKNRNSQNEFKKKNSTTPVPIQKSAPSTIEVDESRMPKPKKGSVAFEEESANEPTLMRNQFVRESKVARDPHTEQNQSQTNDNTIFQAQKQLEEREARKRNRLKAGESPKREDTLSMSIHTVTNRMAKVFHERTMMVASIAGAIVLFALLMVLIRPENKVAEPQDPYLSKLLTPAAKQPERIGDKESAVETKPEVAPAPPASAVATPTAAPSPNPNTSEESPTLPIVQKMREATYQGDFEDVIRIAAAYSGGDLGEEGRALLLEAQLTRAGRNKTRVREIYLKLSDERRNHPNASVFLRTQAVAMLRNPVSTQDLNTGLDILKSLALTRSRDPLIFSYLGETYERLQRMDLAHTHYEQALILQPKFVWVLEHRMQLYSKAGQEELASDMAERLAKLEGKSVDGLSKLAELNFKRGQPAQGITHYRRAIALEDQAILRLNLGVHLKEMGKWDEALKEFEAGLKRSPSAVEKRNLFTQAGSCLCKKKSYTEGLAYFQKALQVKGNGGAAHIFFERGQCEMNMGNNKKAAHSFQSSLKFNPNAGETWLFYGAALLRAKQPKAAVDPLKRSIKLNATDQSYYYLGLAYLQLEKKKDAKAAIQAALKLNPKNKEALTLLPKLR